MATSSGEPNPLRPYYKPPSIGLPQDVPGTTSTGTHGLGTRNGSAASYASSAREMFTDMDYGDYLSDSSPTAYDSVKRHIDEWFYRYMSILLAQPFDVAKTVLQVRSQALDDGSMTNAEKLHSRKLSYRDSMFNDTYPSDDSDPDEPAYFTSSAPSSLSYSPTRRRRRHGSEVTHSPPPKDTSSAGPSHELVLKRSDAILEVISQEWTKEGGWGVWKASNTTFVYSLLLQSLEKWSRGLWSALLNVPDTGLQSGIETSADFANLPYPWASLGVAVAAAATAGIVLAPLDLIRTKLILTPTTTPKRSLTSQTKSLSSYICPTSLFLPTILHSMIAPAISHATPLLLRSRLAIDPVLTPNTYQLGKFMSRVAELFLKLPVETVLRRAQMSVLKTEVDIARDKGTWVADLDTTVRIGEYRGLLGTMWMIVREEGHREEIVVKGKRVRKQEKGQGLPGLWRGWRVGMWGLVGMWTSKALGGNGAVGEF